MVFPMEIWALIAIIGGVVCLSGYLYFASSYLSRQRLSLSSMMCSTDRLSELETENRKMERRLKELEQEWACVYQKLRVLTGSLNKAKPRKSPLDDVEIDQTEMVDETGNPVPW